MAYLSAAGPGVVPGDWTGHKTHGRLPLNLPIFTPGACLASSMLTGASRVACLPSTFKGRRRDGGRGVLGPRPKPQYGWLRLVLARIHRSA